MTTANSPKDYSSEDCRTSKVEVNIDVGVKIFVLKLGLYLPAFLTAIVQHCLLRQLTALLALDDKFIGLQR